MDNIYVYKDFNNIETFFIVSEEGIIPVNYDKNKTENNVIPLNINQFEIKHGNTDSYISMRKPDISITLRDFYDKIGISKFEDSFKINNISEYLIAIDYYRFISFLIHLEVIIKSDESEKYIDLYNKCEEAFERTYNKSIEEIENSIKVEYGKIVSEAAKDRSNIDILRAISIYNAGGGFCFYRGVGHIYYKEAPGIFRNNNEYEESRWYRSMKQSYQKDLDSIHYLDRIAMLQHFDLPTRLLDVTSNPLVALYMAVNNIYVKDDLNQCDYGEVIIYFDELVDNKTYDSNSVLALAALVKLQYKQKKILRDFLKRIDKSIDDHKYYGRKAEKLRKAVNYCIHLSCKHRDCNYRFNKQERNILKKSFGVNTITCPEELFTRVLKLGDKRKIIKEYNDFIDVYFKLLSTIRRENSAFADNLDVFMLNKAFHVTVGMTNERMRVQSCSFNICG